MKTVEDAVRQENGVWGNDGFNAMAWLCIRVNYLKLDENGVLHYNEIGGTDDPVSGEWQLVCTREEFETKAKEMGYGATDDSKDDCSENLADESTVQSLELQQDPKALLLAYLQGQADAGIESAQMALDFYHDLSSKGA